MSAAQMAAAKTSHDVLRQAKQLLACTSVTCVFSDPSCVTGGMHNKETLCAQTPAADRYQASMPMGMEAPTKVA